MKRWTTILAVAVIATAPAWAQETGSSLQNDTTLDREQTNPSSESIAEESGLTITGQVMEVNDTSLRLQSMTGAETIAITPETQGADGLEVGDQVAVDFTRNSQGAMIATQIRPADTGSATGSTAGTMGTTGTMESTTGATGTTASTFDEEADADMADTTAGQATTGATTADGMDDMEMASADQTSTTGTYTGTDALPQTASKTPLVALLGLLALVAATVVRTWVR